MRIVIVSNIGNGIGLQKDFELLRDFIQARGHEVTGQQFDQPANGGDYDLGIFIETINEEMVPMAKRWVYFANPEWLKPDMVRPIQRHCEKVFAKTRSAEQVLRGKFTNVHYVGFLTADKRIEMARERKFLHIGGNGGFRNTNAVISAWREYRYWGGDIAPLTAVSNSKTIEPFEDTLGVTFIKRATDEEITALQNSHLFHLMPSGYEGFGHAIHEAQSVGAVLLTTQAEPMAELKAPFEVPSIRSRKVNMATVHEVSPADIREMASKMLAQPNYEIARMQIEARLRFEQGNKEFADNFEPHLETKHSAVRAATVKTHTSLRIAMLGNFRPAHSTENDLLWTLRDMGHTVIPFQEDEDRTESILVASGQCDLMLYVHTHGWKTPGNFTLVELFAALKRRKVKTASFHLDRYVGLKQLDGREMRVGNHAFWKTDYVFTADGGNQEFFKSRGINHFWLPPGVVKRDCYQGAPRKELICDVGFVGAEGYHPEYPFRGELLSFLRSVYADRFRVFQGYRGSDLNDLYASIGVAVGDSCFGGSDCYWSDRIPETLGRGGFLIHPYSRGLRIPGLVCFEPGNLLELQDRIDYYLASPIGYRIFNEREALKEAAHLWVKHNETYSNRMEVLLRTVGLA